jgi:thiamine-monophosphate kinase
MTLADVGELGLLAELERRGLAEAIEQDAAQIDGLVLTQDTLVEGVHFRWPRSGLSAERTSGGGPGEPGGSPGGSSQRSREPGGSPGGSAGRSWRDLGWHAAAVNISDLSASGAEPIALLVSLAAPASTDVAGVIELYEGIAETGVPVRGGDTTAAPQLVLSVTAIGRGDRVPGRSGARAGDAIVVTGPLGAAGAAFRAGGFVRPPLRIREGRTLARHAHAMLDISDGLAVDAAHLARRSGCRVEIELESVPLADGATVADLAFGEDYELLAAVERPGRFAVIGRCRDGEGVRFTLAGEPYELAGWEHYRNVPSARS